MKFVSITGGLGNQMFIYAFCESLRAKGYKTVLFVPHRINSKAYGHQGYELNKLFDIVEYQGMFSFIIAKIFAVYSQLIRVAPSKLRTKLYKLVGVTVVSVPENFIYYPDVMDSKHKHELFRGTWQSPKFFENAIQTVRLAFEFKPQLISAQTAMVSQELNKVESVGIHIRRGDYLSNQYANGFAGVCTDEYYSKAIEYINNRIEKPVFYVFTDDMEWVKNHFALENAIYIDFNSGVDSWQDMYLMSQCKHNVIANSSFSWWGAWLNSNPDKIVIAPKKWWRLFEKDDVVPESWIRV